MKFLAFTDVHENRNFIEKLLQRAKAQDIDFLLTAGDFTTFGRNLGFVLKKFDALGKKLYLIPGNHESDEIINSVIHAFPYCINFNLKALELGSEYLLLGYGGGGFAVQDVDFRKVARSWYSQYQDRKIIFVTHGPAFGTKLDWLEGRHVGNKDYRAFIERIKPKLAISGHLHETAGATDTIGETKLINPGWDGMMVELG